MKKQTSILYVDDEIINIEVFKLTFDWKYEVHSAESGKEGIEVLQRNSDIQFVISDMKMPGISGIEFISLAKKAHPNLPCMILSGYQEDQEILKALNDKLIIEYMIKPFDKDKIIALIESNVRK